MKSNVLTRALVSGTAAVGIAAASLTGPSTSFAAPALSSKPAATAAANGKASASSTDWTYVSGSDVMDNSGTCKGWMNKRYNADGSGPFTQGLVETWDT